VSSLKYCLEQIAALRFAPSDQRGMFLAFIRRYEYDGVLEMMGRFKVPLQRGMLRKGASISIAALEATGHSVSFWVVRESVRVARASPWALAPRE